jgi:hypothetical protein
LRKRFSFFFDLLDDILHFVSAALPLRPDDGMGSFCQMAGIGESRGRFGEQVLLLIEASAVVLQGFQLQLENLTDRGFIRTGRNRRRRVRMSGSFWQLAAGFWSGVG